MPPLGRDLRLAARAFASRPAFAAAIACSLGLAIGSNTAAFAIIDGVLVTPLPVRDQGSLVAIRGSAGPRTDSHSTIPSNAIRAFRENTSKLARIAAVQSPGAQPFAARERDRLIPLRLTLVTSNLFDVLGVRPVVGRLLQGADDDPGAERVVVLSYRSWIDQFNGDSTIVGRTIELMGTTQRIIGVAPRRLDYPKGTGVWTSLAQAERQFAVPASVDRGFPATLVGRLRADATPRQAATEFASYIDNTPGLSTARTEVIVTPFADLIVGSARRTLMLLLAAVTLVVVMACVNVASLFLSRTLERRKELAVRFALGATRARLLWELGTEIALYGIVSGVAGIAVAAGLLGGARAIVPGDLAWLVDVPFDWRAILFGTVLTIVLTAALAGFLAINTARVDLEAAIRTSTRSAAGDRLTNNLRQGIVVAEVAAAVLVMSSTTLLWRSQSAIDHLNLEFAPRQLLFVGLQLTAPVGRDSASEAAARTRYVTLIANLRERLLTRPNVQSVALVSSLPFEGASDGEVSIAATAPSSNAAAVMATDYVEVQGDYFRTLGIPIVAGRSFDGADGGPQASEVIVNRALAERLWPAGGAVGKTLTVNAEDSSHVVSIVAGVVADAHYADLLSARPMLYLPVRPDGDWPAYLAIRTVGAPDRIRADVRGAIKQSDAGYGIRQMETGSALLGRQIAQSRSLTSVLLALSVVAIVLVATGLFAVLADFVRQRSREMAIRMALGATPSRIGATLARHAGRIVMVGVVLGIAFSAAAFPAIRAMLYGVGQYDGPTWVAVVVGIVVVAAIATAVPMLRVLQSDVTAQLRPE
jgi:putative ABC transport system permease protein